MHTNSKMDGERAQEAKAASPNNGRPILYMYFNLNNPLEQYLRKRNQIELGVQTVARRFSTALWRIRLEKKLHKPCGEFPPTTANGRKTIDILNEMSLAWN